MLRKDLLRVSRVGGGYYPQFVGPEERPLADSLLETFHEHVGERRETLEDAVADLETEVDDFKLVRGLAALLEREATFETSAPIPPRRARRVTFDAAESVGVVSEADRQVALDQAAAGLGVEPADVEASLYADRGVNELLTAFDPRWDAESLIEQYNFSLAQTALFDATEIRIRSADPKALVSAVKRHRLMYEIHRTDAGREVVITGPDALFTRTRRYGTAFARLLRTVVTAPEWTVEATIDDRGTDYRLTLSDGDVSVPGVEPVAEPSFDSGVEADFAGRFRRLGLDWVLVREPEPLETGSRVMIPDFAFDYAHADFRLFFEVMGFWTPEYVAKKLDQLEAVEDVQLLVAVDESLGVGEDVAARDHRVVSYSGSVRVKDVVDVLREYEGDLLSSAVADLPSEMVPDEDVITFEAIADQYGVAVAAVESRSFPDHERVGRTLVRPTVLETLADRLDAGMELSEAESVLTEEGVDETSAVLSRLGYRVAWTGLGGGVVQKKADR